MTYSRMRMHTTIGVQTFHFRVRDGIGWVLRFWVFACLDAPRQGHL